MSVQYVCMFFLWDILKKFSLTWSFSHNLHSTYMILRQNAGKLVLVADMPIWIQSDLHIWHSKASSDKSARELLHLIVCKL